MTGTVPETIACADAEHELLGCLLASSPADAEPILARLVDEDLTVEACRIVVRALRRLIADDAPDLAPCAVLGELRRSGEIRSTALGNGDGAAGVLLASLFGNAPVPLAAGSRLQIVLEHSARRRLQQAGIRLCQAAESGALGTVAGLVEAEMSGALGALTRIVAPPSRQTGRTLGHPVQMSKLPKQATVIRSTSTSSHEPQVEVGGRS